VIREENALTKKFGLQALESVVKLEGPRLNLGKVSRWESGAGKGVVIGTGKGEAKRKNV